MESGVALQLVLLGRQSRFPFLVDIICTSSSEDNPYVRKLATAMAFQLVAMTLPQQADGTLELGSPTGSTTTTTCPRFDVLRRPSLLGSLWQRPARQGPSPAGKRICRRRQSSLIYLQGKSVAAVTSLLLELAVELACPHDAGAATPHDTTCVVLFQRRRPPGDPRTGGESLSNNASTDSHDREEEDDSFPIYMRPRDDAHLMDTGDGMEEDWDPVSLQRVRIVYYQSMTDILLYLWTAQGLPVEQQPTRGILIDGLATAEVAGPCGTQILGRSGRTWWLLLLLGDRVDFALCVCLYLMISYSHLSYTRLLLPLTCRFVCAYLYVMAALLADTVQFWKTRTGTAPVAVVAVQEEDEYSRAAGGGGLVGSPAAYGRASLASLYVSHHWKIVASASAKEDGGWQIVEEAAKTILADYSLRADQSAYEWKLSPG